MGQSVNLTGIVLLTQVIGDFDKRLVILTRERGKITAFAKGARKQNSVLLAACNPFVFGQFTLYEGRTSYNLQQVEVKEYFTELITDFDSACYGFYFLEFADYYTHEGNNESEMLKLLYVTLRALVKKQIEPTLIRYIFELKAFVINGEYPQMFCCVSCGTQINSGHFSARRGGLICADCLSSVYDAIPILESTVYTMQYIISQPLEKLYTFTVSASVFRELKHLMTEYKKLYIDREFKSLAVLESTQ